MADLRIHFFGMPRIEYQGSPVQIDRRKSLALVAYLALSEHRQSRDSIVDLLWPDLDREHGRAALRSTLGTLSGALPFEWIDADRTTIGLRGDAVWVDVRAFTDLLTERTHHQHAADFICDECARLCKEAAALVEADFMAGFTLQDSLEYDDWQLAQREWLRREFADTLRMLSLYHSRTPQYDQAIKYAQQWLAVDPLHEPAHRQLMRLYAVSGQRNEAIRQYKQAVEILDAELATTPEDETTQLYETILSGQVPTLAVPASGKAGVSSVLPQLPALLIGRDEAMGEIKRRLGIDAAETRPVTVIQGWPGVGKSTIVAALAHDPAVAQKFPDGVLWASLGEKPSIISEISTWADALQLSEPTRVRKVEEISAQLSAILRDKRMLLIIDDVWQTEHAQPFRVGGQACAHLITSRLNDVAQSIAPTAFDLYRLPLLSDQAALELLGKLSPETTHHHPEEARELVHDLEGLPLAIHVAGRLLHGEARLGWGVRELLQELRTGAGLLGAQLPSDMVTPAREISPTVAALLKRSTDSLDAETRGRFAVLGLFVPKPATFDLAAMAAAWAVPDARPTARTLVGRGLLEPVSGGRFQMHALLVLHARSLLSEEGFVS